MISYPWHPASKILFEQTFWVKFTYKSFKKISFENICLNLISMFDILFPVKNNETGSII